MKDLNSRIENVETELIDKVEALEETLEETRQRASDARDSVYDLKEEVRFLRKVIDFIVTPKED